MSDLLRLQVHHCYRTEDGRTAYIYALDEGEYKGTIGTGIPGMSDKWSWYADGRAVASQSAYDLVCEVSA